MSEDCEAELSNVMQFLYACPVGLVDFDGDGTIGMMNPMAMQMLRGLDGRPFASNFFSSLESYGPELRNLAEAFAPQRGEVCAQHRMMVRAGSSDGSEEPKVFACTLIKLSGQRFNGDPDRRVSPGRAGAPVEAGGDLVLDAARGCRGGSSGCSSTPDGRIVGAEPATLLQMGLEQHEVIGATLDVLEAPDPQEAGPAAADLIALTRRDGWHLDESWVRQADGGRRRCQRLIVVRSEGDGAIHGFTAVLRTVAGEGFDTATLQRLLRTDHLTGACNRARFFEGRGTRVKDQPADRPIASGDRGGRGPFQARQRHLRPRCRRRSPQGHRGRLHGGVAAGRHFRPDRWRGVRRPAAESRPLPSPGIGRAAPSRRDGGRCPDPC